MPSEVLYHALNVGIVDKNKLHRVDLERMRLAAEVQTNIMADAVGRGFLRPGYEHIALTSGGNKAELVPFVAGGQQVYGLEMTDNAMRIYDALAGEMVSRPAVSTSILNGNFSGGTGWTLGTDAGTYVIISGGVLALQATGRGARAWARQLVVPSANIEHGLRITVYRGPVRFRVGLSAGGQDIVKETVLRTGYHSIAFIPPNSFYVEFSSTTTQPVYVNDINIEAAGIVSLPTVWDTDDLPYLRYDQSLDVMYVACEGRKPQRIETRGDNSFSVCDYDADDGPFIVGRTAEVKLRPTSLERSGSLISNLSFFSPDHIGALFRIYHDGQKISTTLAADNTFTPPIMVTGINEPDYNERDFVYTISGTWAGTLRVQRSFDGEDVEFHNFRKAQGTSDIDITGNVGPVTNDDNEDNAIAYYRIGFEAGTYTSGAAQVDITYQGGGGFGICRVVGYISDTQVEIEILKPFYDTSYTEEWREGAWSENVGWPTCVAIDDGRLNFSGYDAFWGSVSDAYESFDEDFVGDSGPLLRSIAVGGRNEARWLAPLSQMMIGTNTLIAGVRASSLDEIKTPDNFGIRRTAGRIGAARVNPAILADDRALFVESAGTALYELNYDATKGRFMATEFSKLTTDPFRTGIVGVTVQDRPDQRIHVQNQDADAICIVFEPQQQVVGYVTISTDAATDVIESQISLPGFNGQDRVLASIRRVVGGVTSRRLEMLALDTAAVPGPITCCLDAFVVFGPGSATVSLPHLIGRTVHVWMDGASVDDEDGVATEFVVSGAGTITLPSVPTVGGCAGLPYVGRYKSARLEYGSGSTSMLKNKTVAGLGLQLADYCRSGVKFGPRFDTLYDLPTQRNGMPVSSDVVIGPDEDEPVHAFGGDVTFDTRVCIELTKPASILSIVLSIENYGG